MSASSNLQQEYLPGERNARLYWQCRRGMLELDDLLQGFYHQHIADMSEAELQTFESLLKCQDALLLEYLMGRTVPVERAMADVVNKIRQAASR
jgi:antitoxin CptB